MSQANADEPATGEQGENQGRPINPNLRPWPKGQSGNPGGRPKGSGVLSELRKSLDKTTLLGKPLPEGKTARELVGEAILYHVIKGNPGYLKQLLDRLYGPVVMRLDAKHSHSADGVGELPDHVQKAGLEAMLRAAEEGKPGEGEDATQ